MLKGMFFLTYSRIATKLTFMLIFQEEQKKKEFEELGYEETKARRRSLGNIRFIGELFKLKMLTEGIMHDCLLKLLRQSNDEDSLECLCRLMTTVGKELDHPKAKVCM